MDIEISERPLTYFFIFSRDGKLLRNRDVKIEKLAIVMNAKVLDFFFRKRFISCRYIKNQNRL